MGFFFAVEYLKIDQKIMTMQKDILLQHFPFSGYLLHLINIYILILVEKS